MKYARFQFKICGNADKSLAALRSALKKEKMYTKLMKQIPSKHEKYKNMKTWIAMRYARFQFKICGNADKSLAALRSALKKERGNPRLYSQIIDICYQRQ